MAINLDKLYANACENLQILCNGLVLEDRSITWTARELYDKAVNDPTLFSRWYPCLAPALEIWGDAREELSKAKGGTVYYTLKKFIKGIGDSRANLNGAWIDSEGRQCVCDGYRAVRLYKPVEGLKEAPGMDLTNIMDIDPQPTTLTLPTPGELRKYIADPSNRMVNARGDKLYDFGDDLPRVNAKYLLEMMVLLPDAVVTCDGLTKPLVFKSEAGDGLLLPVRKSGF